MPAAVVTGAAGDLGRALCDAFLGDGFAVFGGDIREVDPRPGLTLVPLDVTDRPAVFALAERAAAEAGPLRLWIMPPGSCGWSRSPTPRLTTGIGSSR